MLSKWAGKVVEFPTIEKVCDLLRLRQQTDLRSVVLYWEETEENAHG
jgi:hypothetical protein